MMFAFVLLALASQVCLSLTPSNINDGSVCSTSKTTFISYEAAKSKNEKVMHCGNCGECSNPHDINIYDETRNTLTATARKCAIRSMFLGIAAARSCLDTKVGFTQGCLNCWVDNIACTKKNCTVKCLKYYIFGLGDFVGLLDPCLACDEEKCGPGFALCAGANRRRAGIQSDIDRPDEQVCTLVGL